MRILEFIDLEENLFRLKKLLEEFNQIINEIINFSNNTFYKINNPNLTDDDFYNILSKFKSFYDVFIDQLFKIFNQKLTGGEIILYMKRENINFCENSLINNYNLLTENIANINLFFEYDCWEISRARIFNKLNLKLNNNSSYIFECPRYYFYYDKRYLTLILKLVENNNDTDKISYFDLVPYLNLNNMCLKNKISTFSNFLVITNNSNKKIVELNKQYLKEVDMLIKSIKIINL